MVLGDQGANQLEAHLRFENIFALTKSIQGNSATFRRIVQAGNSWWCKLWLAGRARSYH